MKRTEGYGPWQARGPDPLVRTREGTAILTYFDGYNTASCHARQYGPLFGGGRWARRTSPVAAS